MNKSKKTKDKEEIAARNARRKFLKAEARNAYPKEKKAWDFGRLGKEQVLDTTRLGDRNARRTRKKAEGTR